MNEEKIKIIMDENELFYEEWYEKYKGLNEDEPFIQLLYILSYGSLVQYEQYYQQFHSSLSNQVHEMILMKLYKLTILRNIITSPIQRHMPLVLLCRDLPEPFCFPCISFYELLLDMIEHSYIVGIIDEKSQSIHIADCECPAVSNVAEKLTEVTAFFQSLLSKADKTLDFLDKLDSSHSNKQ